MTVILIQLEMPPALAEPLLGGRNCIGVCHHRGISTETDFSFWFDIHTTPNKAKNSVMLHSHELRNARTLVKQGDNMALELPSLFHCGVSFQTNAQMLKKA